MFVWAVLGGSSRHDGTPNDLVLEAEIFHERSYQRSRRLRSFDRNPNYTRMHHAEGTGSAQRHINDPAPDEWPTVINAAAY